MKPINEAIKKVSKRGLFLPSFLILLMILLFYVIRFGNVFSPVALDSAKDINKLYKQNVRYVEYTFDQLYYSNFDYVNDNKTIGYYYYTINDNTCTFVLISSDHLSSPKEVLTNYTSKAKLSPTDSMYKQMLELFAKELNWNVNGITQSSSSILIDELDYHEHSFLMVLLFIAMLVLTVFCVFLIGSNLIYIAKPEYHPVCLRLRKYGNRLVLLEEANNEMACHINVTSATTYITNTFFVDISMLSITIVPISQVLWAYEHTKWRRLFWVKLKLNYTLNILTKHNNRFYSHRNTKEKIDEMLEFLRQAHPEILIGFSKENKKLIKQILRPGKS